MSETTGTGKWAQPGVPHRGWECVGIEDQGTPAHLCEMCEARMVRYVHVMQHPDYAEELSVGCVCAGHMEQNLARAQRRERDYLNSRHRRARWLSLAWRTSRSGNDYIRTKDGFHVVVYAKGGIWGARVENLHNGRVRVSRRPYDTEDAAKLAAFDAMLGMKE